MTPGRLGILSDTHGLLRPAALGFLRGSERIVHAGDIGTPEILDQLATVAPVLAVRGNNDKGSWARAIPESDLFEFHGVFVYVVHDLAQLDIDPVAAGVHVVVSGHSHQPLIERCNGVLQVNPGSAGPRRFRLPVTAAELIVADGRIEARIVELENALTATGDDR